MTEGTTDRAAVPADESEATEETAALREEGLACDFCGEPAPSVRRVALDGDYERLRTPHAARYACPACSEQKDRERAARGSATPRR